MPLFGGFLFGDKAPSQKAIVTQAVTNHGSALVSTWTGTSLASSGSLRRGIRNAIRSCYGLSNVTSRAMIRTAQAQRNLAGRLFRGESDSLMCCTLDCVARFADITDIVISPPLLSAMCISSFQICIAAILCLRGSSGLVVMDLVLELLYRCRRTYCLPDFARQNQGRVPREITNNQFRNFLWIFVTCNIPLATKKDDLPNLYSHDEGETIRVHKSDILPIIIFTAPCGKPIERKGPATSGRLVGVSPGDLLRCLAEFLNLGAGSSDKRCTELSGSKPSRTLLTQKKKLFLKVERTMGGLEFGIWTFQKGHGKRAQKSAPKSHRSWDQTLRRCPKNDWTVLKPTKVICQIPFVLASSGVVASVSQTRQKSRKASGSVKS